MLVHVTIMKLLPSLDIVNNYLSYEPETGLFRWKVTNGPCVPGSVAGYKADYVRIRLKGQVYMAHRIAWLIMTGKDPKENIVHHKDTNKMNNRAVNLELADHSTNGCVTLRGEPKCYQRTGKNRAYYQACFTLKGKKILVGTFKTAEEASKAGREARRKARNL